MVIYPAIAWAPNELTGSTYYDLVELKMKGDSPIEAKV
jgi:hypothetical protein